MRIVIFIFLLMTPKFSFSQSVDIDIEESGRIPNHSLAKYAARINRWDVPGDYENTRNPLYECTDRYHCTLEVRLRYEGQLVYFGARVAEGASWLSSSKTYGELARNFQSHGYIGLVTTVITNTAGSKKEGARICVSFLTQNYDWRRDIPGTFETCHFPAIEPTVCQIPEASINLVHGGLTADLVNGHTASSTFHVRCTFPFRVRLVSADEQGQIILNAADGFRSDIAVNGVSIAGKGVLIDATPGGTAVNITSTLRNYAGKMGNFNGAMVLIVAAE
jgi:hypothetical protein